MKRYAEPDKEFKVQPRGTWTEIYSTTLEVWMSWLKGEQEKYIDPELLTLIQKLNANGFITHSCCAGHDGHPGMIAFYGLYTKADIEELLAPYYLKIIDYSLQDDECYKREEAATRARFPEYVSPNNKYLPITLVEFEAVGQSKRRKRRKGKQLVLIGK